MTAIAWASACKTLPGLRPSSAAALSWAAPASWRPAPWAVPWPAAPWAGRASWPAARASTPPWPSGPAWAWRPACVSAVGIEMESPPRPLGQRLRSEAIVLSVSYRLDATLAAFARCVSAYACRERRFLRDSLSGLRLNIWVTLGYMRYKGAYPNSGLPLSRLLGSSRARSPRPRPASTFLIPVQAGNDPSARAQDHADKRTQH